MKLTALTVKWDAKVGLPNYSHIFASAEAVFEIEDHDDQALSLPMALATVKAAVKESLSQKAKASAAMEAAVQAELG